MIDPKTGLPPRYLRAPDAARFLGISIRTLEKHRTYGTGPTYRKIGGRIVYSVDDLQAWTEDGIRKPGGNGAALRRIQAEICRPRNVSHLIVAGIARVAGVERHIEPSWHGCLHPAQEVVKDGIAEIGAGRHQKKLPLVRRRAPCWPFAALNFSVTIRSLNSPRSMAAFAGSPPPSSIGRSRMWAAAP